MSNPSENFEARRSLAKTPQEARDEIAALIIDAGTQAYTVKGLQRKLMTRLGDKLTDIGERIAAIEYIQEDKA